VWSTDDKWYDAIIIDLAASGLFHVRYDDGIERSNITERQIRARGAKITGGNHDHQASCSTPGLTRRCDGICVSLQNDDNNCGAWGTRCTSGKHFDGHRSCRDAAGNL
jgi:hypothetical protein